MDPDKLAERDRARRQRQLRRAKWQAIGLLLGVVVLLAWAISSYFVRPKKVPPPKEKPAAPVMEETAASSADKPAAGTAPATDAKPPVAAAAPEKPAAPAPPTAASTPTTAAPEKPGPSNTLKGPDVLKRFTDKPKVAVSEVLGAIGVKDSAKMMRELPKVQEARRVLDLLSKVSYVAGKLEYVIEKPGIELRMKDYYETRGLKEPAAGDQVADVELQLAGERYLDVVYANGAQPSGTIRASFVRDERGMVRLDWESFVGYSAMGMREFRDKKPDVPAIMRVYASVDDYYNYEFSDPKKFLSVRLRNPDGSEAVNGFCEQGGRVASAITARLATSSGESAPKGEAGAAKRVWAPVVVKVRFPSNPQSDHCVELMELMHGQWLAPAGLVE